MHFQSFLPDGFDDRSRVWIYQATRLFTMQEALRIEDMLQDFITGWNSHGTPVKGYGNLLFGQFVVLVADETATGVSGCSTDSSVRLIREVERMTGVAMFDRLMLAFVVKEKVQVIPFAQLSYALQNDFIDGSTLYFNNTVLTLGEMKNNWLIPVRESWLGADNRFANQIDKPAEIR